MIAIEALVVDSVPELLATAAIEWLPLERVVVFKERLNGALVTLAPELIPSTSNCTLVVLDETLVVILMVPATVEPDAGAVMEIVGAAGATIAEKPFGGLGGGVPTTCALKAKGGFGAAPGAKNSAMLGAVAAPPKPLKFTPKSSAVRRSELSCE